MSELDSERVLPVRNFAFIYTHPLKNSPKLSSCWLLCVTWVFLRQIWNMINWEALSWNVLLWVRLANSKGHLCCEEPAGQDTVWALFERDFLLSRNQACHISQGWMLSRTKPILGSLTVFDSFWKGSRTKGKKNIPQQTIAGCVLRDHFPFWDAFSPF